MNIANNTNVGSVFFKISTNRGAFTKEMKSTASGVESVFGKSMKAVGKTIATAFSVAAVVGFGKKCVQVASETQSAWIGLNSILNGQGKSFSQANSFIQDYIKDGLVPLNNAVTAYKNLAARGYDTKQIEQTMTSLKDAAAFGRQASYSMGDAVQTATEGLKNENSILVDNAGVTKNVSKMWEEYAASIGKNKNQLTQQEKIQAEVNGILQETKWQVGDAARYSETFAGKMAKITATTTALKTSIGNTLIPVLNQFIPILQTGLDVALNFCNAMQSVMASLGWEMPDVSSFSSALGNTSSVAVDTAEDVSGIGTAAEKAAKKAKGAFASFDEINVLKKPNVDSSAASGGGASTAISGIGNPAADISKSISDNMSKAFDPLVEAWKNKGEALINSIKTSFENIKTLFGEIKKSFENIWTNGTAQTSIEHILGILTNVFNIIGNIAKAFANAWKGGNGDAIVQNLADAFNDVLYIVEDVGKCISDWWASERGQSFANTTTEMFQKISNAVKRVSDALREIWDNGGRDVFNNLQNAFGSIGEIIEIIIGYVADIYADIVERFAPDAENALGKLNDKLSAFNDFLDWLKTDGKPILEGIADIIVIASAAWVAYKGTMKAVELATKAYAAAQAAVNAVMNANPVSLVVAAIVALIAIIVVCIRHWDEIKEAAKKALDKIKETWNNIGEWFKTTVVDPIKNFFSGMWKSIKDTFSNVKTFFTTKFSEAWQGIKNVFSPVGNFFGGIWNTIKSKFTNIGQKIGDAVGGAFKKAVNAVMQTVENVVNTPIRAINSLIGIINKVPGINLGTLNTFSLPRLAQGGWVAANNPRLAVIGDNKREGEIVTPESKIREQVEAALAKVGGAVQKIKLELELIIKYPDGRTIIKTINEAQIAEGRILLEI